MAPNYLGQLVDRWVHALGVGNDRLLAGDHVGRTKESDRGCGRIVEMVNAFSMRRSSWGVSQGWCHRAVVDEDRVVGTRSAAPSLRVAANGVVLGAPGATGKWVQGFGRKMHWQSQWHPTTSVNWLIGGFAHEASATIAC